MGPHPRYSANLSIAPFKYSPHRTPYKNGVDQSQQNIQNANAISILTDCGGLKQENLVYVKCSQRKWVLGSVRQVTERGIKVWLHSPQTMANVSLSIAFTHILTPLEKILDCSHLPNGFSLSEIPQSGIYELRIPLEIVRPARLAHRRLFHTLLLGSLHVHDHCNWTQNEQRVKISVPTSNIPSPSLYDSSGTPKRRLSFCPHEVTSLPYQHNLSAIRKAPSSTFPANDNCNNKGFLPTRRYSNAGPVESQDRVMFLARKLNSSPGLHTDHGGSSPDQNSNMRLTAQGKSMENFSARTTKLSPRQCNPRLISPYQD